MKRYQLVVVPTEFKYFYCNNKSYIFGGKIHESSNTKSDLESIKLSLSDDDSIERMQIVDLAILENLKEYEKADLMTENEKLYMYYHEYYDEVKAEEIYDEALESKIGEEDNCWNYDTESGNPEVIWKNMQWEKIDWNQHHDFVEHLESQEKYKAEVGKILAPIYDVEY